MNDKMKIVVLDDDPTGVQTVHDIFVYTNWKADTLKDAFQDGRSLFYILTNSRSMTEAETTALHHEIAGNVDRAAKETGYDYMFISRSDSTLRGHYPVEPEVLKEEYEKNTGRKVDAEILCFFFKDGGRITRNNIHYVKQSDGSFLPACETEFAKDKTFGYSALTMPEYVEEKTGGRYPAESVACISLEEIRSGDTESLCRKLMTVRNFNKIIVNAEENEDIAAFCEALKLAMSQGHTFMIRSAASIVQILGGIPSIPPLAKEDMVQAGNRNGGLVVIGSHTAKTTKQLEYLKELENVNFIEMDVEHLETVPEIQKQINNLISSGKNVCVYTSRKLITAGTGNKEDDLKLSMRISDAVTSLVTELEVLPKFIIAKGGITSSEIGVKALRVSRALVLGQIFPGIPVWKTDPESRFPGIPYVVFPGNVGTETDLRDAVLKLD